jgi:hypothetical protein
VKFGALYEMRGESCRPNGGSRECGMDDLHVFEVLALSNFFVQFRNDIKCRKAAI